MLYMLYCVMLYIMYCYQLYTMYCLSCYTQCTVVMLYIVHNVLFGTLCFFVGAPSKNTIIYRTVNHNPDPNPNRNSLKW